jgi:hypothetical protein
MTTERPGDDDALLDEALASLPEPELPDGLRRRLEAIPARGNVRRFPLRTLRVSALGWAAAAALGLFIGSRSLEPESAANGDGAFAETASSDSGSNALAEGVSDEDAALAFALGSFAEFEEEP